MDSPVARTPAAPGSVRQLKRADLGSYFETLLLGIGNLERAVGVDVSAEGTFRGLERRSIWTVFRLLQVVGRPFANIFVEVHDRVVAGTGTILWLPRSAYVAGMATRPEYRGRGIASRILAEMRTHARRRRRPWLVLDVDSDNSTAIRVYERAGYHAVETYAWLTRQGLPAASERPSNGARLVPTGELATVAEQLGNALHPEIRSALPPRPRLLTHNELLARNPGTRDATWTSVSSRGQLTALRVYFVPRPGLAAYFPIGTPSLDPEQLPALIEAATEWVRPFAPTRSFSVLPRGMTGAVEVFARYGFSLAVSSTLMIRPSGDLAQPGAAGAETSASTKPS